jgi:hypothetical protein
VDAWGKLNHSMFSLSSISSFPFSLQLDTTRGYKKSSTHEWKAVTLKATTMASLSTHLQSIVTINSTIYPVPLKDDSIRIVQLHPGETDEPVSCSFNVVGLGKGQSFQALSYCWGSDPSDEPITCNGQSFSPTRNLFEALKQLRLVSEVRYMWIDAVW